MKKFRKQSVTVGIAAYNEGKNIASLLNSILTQTSVTGRVVRCIVVADGCTDNTVSEVRSLHSRNLKLIINAKRIGQALSQSKILRNVKSDYLVLLNGDVQIKQSDFIEKLIHPFSEDSNIGLVGGNCMPLPAENHFESVINYGVKAKSYLFEQIHNKDNIFLCHGRVRAFSKTFLKSFTWKKVINEDAYSYICCKKNNLNFYFKKDAVIYYRSPQNIHDHMKQSKRFLHAKKELNQYFSAGDVDAYYAFPTLPTLKTIVKYLLLNPVLSMQYAIIQAIVVLHSTFHREIKVTFAPSLSSKDLSKRI